MARRPNWKGYLKLSLVSCPVALYTAASTSERTALHLINRKTGNRLRRQLIDSQTGDVVEDEDQARGYEMSRGEYVLLEDEELDKIALESTHTVDIERFVPRTQVDGLYLDTPYYMAPDGEVGEEAFAVIRDAMKAKKVVGIARVVLYRRERIVMLEPRERGIVATILRYAYEVRRAADYGRHCEDRGAGRNARPCRAHHRDQGGRFRSDQIRGSLRGSAGRVDQIEAIRQSAEGRSAAAARQRRQSHGWAKHRSIRSRRLTLGVWLKPER
jgi:DNA end-binding protein Ku